MRKTTLGAMTIAALLLLASTNAHADEALDVALDRMANATGEEYVAARGALTADETARARLEALLDGARWTDETFKKLAFATIAHAHVVEGETVAKVSKLRGLDPAVYTARRRAEPECGRELRALGRAAVGPMLELYLKTFDRYAFSTDERGARERLALREGLVVALSVSGHPAAFFVCRDIARSSSEAEAIRVQAIEGLGDVGTREAFAEIRRLHAGAETAEALKLAAIRAAGAVPSASALEFLRERLGSDSSAERKTAVVALGLLGSPWAWEARGEEAARTTGEQVRRDATAALVAAFDKLAGECPDQLVDSIATVAHESAIELLAAKVVAHREVATRALERVRAAIDRNKR